MRGHRPPGLWRCGSRYATLCRPPEGIPVPIDSHERGAARQVSILGMKQNLMKSQPGPPMTLGNAAAARVRLIVWCKACGHRVEPDAAEMAKRYGANTVVPK